MIGHYLLTLTEEQEDRVLTMRMGIARAYVDGENQCGCLKGTVHGLDRKRAMTDPVGWWPQHWSKRLLTALPGTDVVGIRYDDLCERFGTDRVNAAIRNRILNNRARRTLQREVRVA